MPDQMRCLSRKWKLGDKVSDAPQQRNGRDCGVFVLILMTLLVKKQSFDHLAEEVKDEKKYAALVYRYRLRLARNILQGERYS